MPVVARVAALSLDVIVVGGGVAGLAVAYMLSVAGHRVRVIERYRPDAPGGSQRIPPNLSKILRQWVGDEELRRVATRCVRTPFHHWKYIGQFHWKPAVMAETGGEFLMMHREDLVRLLHKLATDAGASIRLDTEVVSIQQGLRDRPGPSVTLGDGKILTADLVVGADGCRSRVRDAVLEEEDRPEPSGMSFYTGAASAEDVRSDPELGRYLHNEEWPIWMGDRTGLYATAVRSGAELSFMLFSFRGSKDYKEGGNEGWDEKHQAEELLSEEQCPIVRRLVKMAPHLVRTQWMSRPNAVEDWVDSSGRMVLVGDAAHPTIPGGTHSTSLAVEDAVVLGCLLSHIRAIDQLPTFLSAYEELRRQRCATLVYADVRNTMMMSLPPGAEADARDAQMGQTLDDSDMDEGALKAQFEEFAEVFLYDAGDAAEEWWINWGRFHDNAAREHSGMMDFVVSSVSVEMCA
ncbi:FAD/NAD(P)-binding domain-containing protein [Earliella scabrosa]|nr:FAD/NAD(P)-binding domain-containing protein [Earliella scabrosa]